jgi:hypothetical protein
MKELWVEGCWLFVKTGIQLSCIGCYYQPTTINQQLLSGWLLLKPGFCIGCYYQPTTINQQLLMPLILARIMNSCRIFA